MMEKASFPGLFKAFFEAQRPSSDLESRQGTEGAAKEHTLHAGEGHDTLCEGPLLTSSATKVMANPWKSMGNSPKVSRFPWFSTDFHRFFIDFSRFFTGFALVCAVS